MMTPWVECWAVNQMSRILIPTSTTWFYRSPVVTLTSYTYAADNTYLLLFLRFLLTF